MKKISTRITSLVVAICMLISLIPAAPLNVRAEAAESEYAFIAGGAQITLDFQVNYGNNTSIKDVAQSAGNWVYNSELTSATVNGRVNHATFYKQYAIINGGGIHGLKLNMYSEYGDLVLDFEVEKAGYYRLDGVIKGVSPYSGSFNVSVKSGDTTTLIGNVDMTDITQTSWAKATLPSFATVYLNQGTNHLVFSGTANGAESLNNILLEQLVFTEMQPVEEEEDGFVKGENQAALDFTFGNKQSITEVTSMAQGGWLLNYDLTSSDHLTMMKHSTYYKWYIFQNAWGFPGLKMNLRKDLGDVVLDFNVPEDGWYDLTGVVHGDPTYSGKAQVSLISDGTRTLLGEINLGNVGSASGWAEVTMPDFEMVYLKEGKNQIVFTGTVNGAENMNNILLKSITLTQYILLEAEAMLILGSSTALAGEEVNVKAWVNMKDGSVLDAENMPQGDSITVTSSDPQIASVGNGVINAISEGTVDIKMEAIVDGENYEKTLQLTVINMPQPSFKLVADAAYAVGVGKKTQILVQGAYTNVVVDMTAAESVSAVSSDEDIATASAIYKGNDLYIDAKGIAEGETEITVSAVYEGLSAEVIIPIKVAKGASKPSAYIMDLTAKSWDNHSLQLNGVEVDREKTNPEIMLRYSTIVYPAHSAKVELNEGESFYLNFNVTADGEYAIDFKGSYTAQLGFKAAFYIDDQFIGEYNFSDLAGGTLDTDTGYRSEHFRNIALKAGTHSMKIERVSKEGRFMWLHSFIFTPVAASPTVVGVAAQTNKKTVTPGETMPNSFTVRMSDGTDYHIPEVTENQGSIEVINRVPERMSFSNFVMKALKSGISMFEVNASVPEENGDITCYWTTTVKDGQLFDFTGVYADKKPSTLGLYENGWAINAEETTIDTDNDDYKMTSSGMGAVLESSQVLAVDLNVESDGIYNVDALCTALADTGCKADVYLDDAYLGRIDFAADSSVTLNTVEVKSGVNTLYVKKADAADSSNICIKQLAIIKVSEFPEFSHITLSADSSEIELYKTLQATAAVWTDDGRRYHIGPNRDGSIDEENKITYSVTPSGVFSSDINGLLTGNTVGKATLSAAAVVNGESIPAVTKEFSVVNVLRLEADTMFRMIRGETVKATLSATLDDIPIDIAQATEFTVTPEDYRAEGKVVVEDGNAVIYITGLRGGETSVTVEAVYNGVTGSKDIPVTVIIPSNNDGVLSLEFRKNKANVPSTPDEADIAVHNWQINREQSSPYSLDNPNYKMDTYGLKSAVRTTDEQFAFDFMLNSGGNYAIDMLGTQVGFYGIHAAMYIDGEYIGEFDFSHPTDPSDKAVVAEIPAVLNSISLASGKHTVTIKRLADSKGDNYFWLGQLNFRAINGELYFEHVNARVGKDILCVNESTDISAQAIMSDGSVRHMGSLMSGGDDPYNYIKVTNSNPAVAEIKDGRIYALSPGETTITVIAAVDGAEKSESFTVTVDDKTLTSVEAKLTGELFVNKTAELEIKAMAGEREIDPDSVEISVSSEGSGVVSLSGTSVTGLSAGTETLTVTAQLGQTKVSKQLEVTVSEDGIVSITVGAGALRMRPDSQGTQITVEGGSFLGQPIDLSDADITYDTQQTDIISISETGYVTPLAVGEATATVTVKKGIFEASKSIVFTVTNGKLGRSYYTDEKVANARENISKFSWAKSEMDSVVKIADRYANDPDILWNLVTTQELPRGIGVGYRYDPKNGYCRYCDADLSKYGSIYHAWITDPLNSPWKVQCPECRRKFPTNDFGSFYKLGIDENGEWSYEQSHQEHYYLFADEYAAKGVETYEEYNEMRASGKRLPGVGYLKNTTATEVGAVDTVNNGRGLSGDETAEAWGVDDGYGYKTGKTYATAAYGDFEESHTYIACYTRELFAINFESALYNLSRAYMYTGKNKYGRAGAILLDRIADVYPDMDIGAFFPYFAHSDSTSPYGRVEGCIWETTTCKWWIHAYDALYPAFDDPYVISYLSEKAEKYSMENSKETGNMIRQNIEDGVLREVFKGIKDGDIYGNFGMHQQRIAEIAVVLDSMPESKEILDYLMAPDEKGWRESGHTGGDVLDNLLNGVDRDGGSGEGVSPSYSVIWYDCISAIAEVINGYKAYEAADLFKHPVVQKMLENSITLVQARRATAAVGDSGVTAGLELYFPADFNLMRGFRATNSVLLAQSLYFKNNNSVEGIHEDIFTKDPEKIQEDILSIIEQHGEFPFDDSLMNAEQGYATIRDGSIYGRNSLQQTDNQRGFWMNFGFYGTHSHYDALNLGLHAYGLDFAPDLGYPTAADGGDEQMNWGIITVNHNTAVVDDSRQAMRKNEGTPLHFDDQGRVKVMDVDMKNAYAQTETYRRTVVMVEVDDNISYGLDFFNVKGGLEHLYSFHSQSNNIGEYGGFSPEELDGTYAGENVPYRAAGIVNGYSYLTDVRKAEDPGANEFYVDFDVTDFRNAIDDNDDLHLRLTMLNDFEASEITFAKGETPVRGNNPRWLEYVLVRHSSQDGQPLESVFTTVLEPYKGERYISDTEQVSVARTDGMDINTNGDVVKAVKVTLANGREDYIIYATNNRVEYIVDKKITFRGTVGVCSYSGKEVVYSYLNDGVKLGELETKQEYTGEVVDFTRSLEFENTITVRMDDVSDFEAFKEEVVGRWMYVENDGSGNGAYLIKDITRNSDDTLDISIGNVNLIRSGENITLQGGDFVYNIAPKQWFNIPLSATADTSPKIDPVDEVAVAAGSKFTTAVKATSPIEKELTLTATALPRGASFDAETGVITWTPDSRQIGDHHVAICADDGVMQTTLHFTVTVFKSSSGSGSNSVAPLAPGAGTSSGTSGAQTDTSGENGESTGNTEVDAPVTPAERFIDLGGHAWAKEAIYRLVDKGVVNGTSENTYSPAANIKRADFAIMLVRAFGITEGEGENFADVDPNKYYAEELRAARVSGIVNGVGQDKFNPEGEITRQDMMLMLSRALDAVGYELSEADRSVLTQFADAADISEYAADAVSRVVKDGIIAGANGRINPLENATRAEVAVMLDRVLAE